MVSAGLFCATAIQTEAQEAKPLSVEDSMDTRSFTTVSHISISPDAQWLAYSVRENRRMVETSRDGDERERLARTGVFAENQGTDIWISNIVTGAARNLTGRQGSNWDPSWSPDGRYLAFLSDRDGSGQARLWLWNAGTNRLQLVSTVNIRSEGFAPAIEWTPDAKAVVVCTIPESMSPQEYVERVRTSGPLAHVEKVPDSSAVVYKATATTGATRAARINLDTVYLHDVTRIDVEGGKVTRLSHGQRIGWYSLSPDGSRAAYLVVKGLHPMGAFRRIYDLVSVDLRTLEEHKLAENTLIADIFGWSPDSAQLVFFENAAEKKESTMVVVAAEGGPRKEIGPLPRAIGSYVLPAWDASGENVYMLINGALWRFNVAERKASEVAKIPGLRIARRIGETPELLWSDDGGKSTLVVAVDDERKRDAFYRIDLVSGEASKTLDRGECIDCLFKGSNAGARLVAASHEVIAFIAQDARHSPDLWVSDPAFQHTRQLTHLNPQFDAYAMGTPRLVDWLDADGHTARGALLLPPKFASGKRCPLIVFVYPTTMTNSFDQFSFGVFPGPLNLHLFATRGYAVFLPDVRKDFANMRSMATSVLLGINEMVRLGIADPDQIGVMGHSAGGYETLALVIASPRFRAALDISGVSDFLSLYGQLSKDGTAWESDELVEELGGTPWQRPIAYLENSPMYFLDRVQTPLLIAHGSEDGSVRPEMGEAVFVGLRQLGKEVEYARYLGESHVTREWSFANQTDLCRRVLDWFVTHFMAEPIDRQQPE
jgi:dipeptidyl aminopeptidase/acylaminoacyl peptidase